MAQTIIRSRRHGGQAPGLYKHDAVEVSSFKLGFDIEVAGLPLSASYTGGGGSETDDDPGRDKTHNCVSLATVLRSRYQLVCKRRNVKIPSRR